MLAVPAGDGTHLLAEDPGGTELSVQQGMIVLHTAVARLVAEACGKRAAATPTVTTPTAISPTAISPAEPAGGAPAAATGPPGAQPVAPQQATQMTAEQSAPGSPADALPPALYTKEQAAEGRQIFATKCVVCHGINLQGTAAPSVAGNDFLVTAQHNGWTLSIIRYLVFKLMPLNAPSSLSPTDDADLMAFLLASNCYPAGPTPFPFTEDPAFANIKLGPVPGKPDGQNAAGVCKVD
jgi:mono/diheme cytochrome c family protein